MKLALAMMFRKGEADWMKLHLPVFAQCFDGIVAVSDDTTGDEPFYLTRHFAGNVYSHPFNNNWSEMLNHLIDHAEKLGYDALVRIDPDEEIFDRDVDAIRELLGTYSVLCLPRYNFWGDRLHYTPGLYPDWQLRAFRLNVGLRYNGQHHESINWNAYGLHEGDPQADAPRQVLRVPSVNIYHYGNVGRERILERDLHYLNVAREQAGHPPLTERPADRAFPTRHNIPFCGPQPLDPAVVGATAPFEE